jgi:hypothetical protein
MQPEQNYKRARCREGVLIEDRMTTDNIVYTKRPRRKTLVKVDVDVVVVLPFAATRDGMRLAALLKLSSLSSSVGTMGKEAQSLMPQRFSPRLIQKCPSMPQSANSRKGLHKDMSEFDVQHFAFLQ